MYNFKQIIHVCQYYQKYMTDNWVTQCCNRYSLINKCSLTEADTGLIILL